MARRRNVTKDTSVLTWCFWCAGLIILWQNGDDRDVIAFSSPSILKESKTPTTRHSFPQQDPLDRTIVISSISRTASTNLFFFRKKKDEHLDEDHANDAKSKDNSETSNGVEDSSEGFGASLKRRLFRKGKDGSSLQSVADSATENSGSSVTATATATSDESPESQAARLRAQAERVRLEAERLDAELTLQKIARLEKELETRKRKKKDSDKDDDDDDNLRKQMEALQNKLLGKDKKPDTASSMASQSRATTSGSTSSSAPAVVTKDLQFDKDIQVVLEPEDIQALEAAPGFLKKALASALELENTDELNVTELAMRIEGTSKVAPPMITDAQIEERVHELRLDNSTVLELLSQSPDVADNITIMSDKEIAKLSLEYEAASKEEEMSKLVQEFRDLEGEFLQPTIDALDQMLNRSLADSTIEALYPKCIHGDGQEEHQLPSEGQVKQLCEQILPKVSFSATSRPEPVLGGYVIRGRYMSKKNTKGGDNEEESSGGDDLIEAIQAELDKTPSLANKMTVLFAKDFTVFSDPDAYETFDPSDSPPILYVVGPEVVRKPQRVLLSVTTALGLATSWYLSIYPFLLNPTINKRVEEELAVVSALTSTSSQTPDLNWLPELSVPLFISFLGVQLAHELAHLVVAGANNVKMSVPTFVPSIITGITSSVTTFKELPKNKQAMFDISIAGPLVGMIISTCLIAIGSQLTLSSDPNLLPHLPLDILRQSTLGGGIINGILGNGALAVPEGAIGTPAVAAITIPLHPFAVAGYISLVLNALAVLPVGTTDGGRVGIALFGRGAKLIVGNLFLFVLFAVGFVGSDLFLFYFLFCIAFQAGNEVPAKNEVDKVDFSRIIVATAAYSLALLSLIPFQGSS